MSKRAVLLLIAILAVSALPWVRPASASDSIPKPSVPEFTVKLIDSSYDLPPTSSVDPYTGQTVTQAGYHVESRTIKLSIKNQPFTPYLITENGNNWTVDFYYSIRWKGHFGQDWHEIRHSEVFTEPFAGANLESEYTVISFEGEYSSSEGLKLIYQGMYTTFPPGAQIDFQVEAMIGYIHHVDAMPFSADVFEGETSGWSNTQTLSIPSDTQSPSPDDGTPSDGGTQQIEPSSFILGVAVTAIVVAVGAGLLLYFKKRKR